MLNATEQGAPYPFSLAATLPPDLLEAPRWMVFALAWETDAKTGEAHLKKTPYNARTGKLARSNDARTWSTFAQACKALASGTYGAPGELATLGYATGDGFACVDLDKCRDADTGALTPDARAIVDELASYSEVSPSGTGVHVWMRGELPNGGRKRDAGIEIYTGSQFITITGATLEGAPPDVRERTDALAALHARVFAKKTAKTATHEAKPTPDAQDTAGALDDGAVIERAMRAKNGADFARLYFQGDTSGYGNDASRADLALIGYLRFYTQGDAAQMARLFRRSALMRDKWDERHASDGATYGELTIRAALSGVYDVWTPRADRLRQEQGQEQGQEAASGDVDETSDCDSAHGRESQSSALIRIALTAELFRTPDGNVPHARAKVNGHYETWALGEKGGGFKRWLVHQYFQAYGRAPGDNAVSQALSVIIAQAIFRGGVHRVHLRLAEHDGKVYHDLGDTQWHCVEIDSNGWRVVENPPVYFRRPRSYAALPLPERGGTLDELRPLIGPQSNEEWMLICAWLVGTFHPRGPYTHLSVSGHAGAGKSTKTRMLRTVIDPSEAPTRGDPKDERDLAVAAHNNRVLALDNLSYVPPWLSDFLCQLATGSGRGYRSLYSDDEETIFNARRPVIFNGIEEVATKGDLLDRTISVSLARIPDEERQSEGDLETAFTAAHGRILGALYDAVACALKHRPGLHVSRLPRMADFALWIVAASPALRWDGARFLEVYAANRETSIAVELDASPIAAALLRFMQDRTTWIGAASELYELLTPLAGEAVQHTRSWPSSPRGLSGALKRLAPSLEAGEGLEIIHGKDDTRQPNGKRMGRFISITHKQASAGDANGDAKSNLATQTIIFASPDESRALAGSCDVATLATLATQNPGVFPISFDSSSARTKKEDEKSREREEKQGSVVDRPDFASPASPASPAVKTPLICPICGGSDIRDYGGDLRCYIHDVRPIQLPANEAGDASKGGAE